MKTSYIVAGLIVIVVLFIGFSLSNDEPSGVDVAVDKNNSTSTEENSEIEQENKNVSEGTTTENQEDADASVVVVTYTNEGYQPENVTINTGETVRFVNESDGPFWPASDVHPTHTEYDGTSLSEHCEEGGSFDACDRISSGESYSFTFDKAGTWDYHDHLQASHTGTVVVE